MAKSRILIIEDDSEVRELLRTILSRAGYEISVASDGIQGIHAFRTDPTDLIITDLVMPGKEGLETIVDLKREFPDLKIIAISGGGQDGQNTYLNAAKLCGATMTFRKPFKNVDILAAVKNLLDQQDHSES